MYIVYVLIQYQGVCPYIVPGFMYMFTSLYSTRVYVHVHVLIQYQGLCTCTCVCTLYVCMYQFTYVYMYMCMYICTLYMYVHVCIYSATCMYVRFYSTSSPYSGGVLIVLER